MFRRCIQQSIRIGGNTMRIIGREQEQKTLESCMLSGRPEFIAVYGRRRVGKTYLIREYELCFLHDRRN